MPLPVALTASKDQIPWTRASGLDICLFIPHKKYALSCVQGQRSGSSWNLGLGKQAQSKSREMSVAKACLKGRGMVLPCEKEDETRHEDSSVVTDRTIPCFQRKCTLVLEGQIRAQLALDSFCDRHV